MFRSLRSRLLVSYLVVIATVLVLVAVALFFFATRPTVRFLPSWQRLSTIAQATRNELTHLEERGADNEAVLHALEQIALDYGVRILIIRGEMHTVLFDTATDTSWQGESLGEVEVAGRGVSVPAGGGSYGRYRHTDGSRWLVYVQPTANGGRSQIVFAQPEPSAMVFFRESFSGSLVAAGLVAFLLSLLLAFGIAGWVARPLQRMAQATEAIAQGDYEQTVPVHGPEEVRRVARNFNSMVRQVRLSRQSQRDFVANVSHDLKTPLTSIRGWSQALLDGTADTPEARQRAATIIYNETERMSRMVNQLLDLARIESGQLELNQTQVDLTQLLTEVYHSFVPKAEEQKIHLTLDARPTPPVWGDYDRLVQVFTNLVDNALTHTPEGGRVHLAARPYGTQAVEAWVQDTGKGIPPEDLSRIFERFYQVDKSRMRENGRRGTGLGLAIVQELIAAHNGRIQVRSEVGKGSQFVVRLPISNTPEHSTVVRRQE